MEERTPLLSRTAKRNEPEKRKRYMLVGVCVALVLTVVGVVVYATKSKNESAEMYSETRTFIRK